jgi:cell shape-determining protein MreD
MTEGTRWQFAGLIATLVVLHFVLRVGLQLAYAPDLLVVALLLAARRLRPGSAAGLGLLLGVLDGAARPFAMGASALAFCVLAYLASRSKEYLVGDNPFTLMAYLAFGKWLFDVALWMLLSTRGHAPPVATLVVSMVAAVYAGLAGLAAVTAYRVVT